MSTSSKKITLKSSDGEMFEVDVEVACESLMIKNMIEYDCSYVDSVIPITNLTGKILAKVIEYCKKHVYKASNTMLYDPVVSDELKAWDASFVMVDLNTLFDLILAANFLNIKELMDLACETVANKIRGKSPEEIRKVFGIKDEFTPEEEEEVRKENHWAFE